MYICADCSQLCGHGGEQQLLVAEARRGGTCVVLRVGLC